MSGFVEPPRSRSSVKSAGKRIAKNEHSNADISLVDQWRASHAYVINNFQIFLRRRIEKVGVDAQFAQRLKRRNTVIDKLRRVRPDGTPLISDVASMNDFAGCRLIFNNIHDLRKCRDYINSPASLSNVNHRLRFNLDKYDYIEAPKSTGYRGIHDVYMHFPRPHRRDKHKSSAWDGLLVEIQYRTIFQHAWATALEISDIIDGQRTKFALDSDDRVQFFALTSELIARKYEQKANALQYLSDSEIISKIRDLEKKLHILQRLGAIRQFEDVERLRRHNVLNIVSTEDGGHMLEVENFKNSKSAIERTMKLEEDSRSINAVYVQAKNPNQLRRAYQNYFNDPVDFVRFVNDAVTPDNSSI